MFNENLVSIIIPAYNCEDFIKETLESIINQSYKNWEGIIVNDSSTDKTAEIIMEFIEKDQRFKLFNLKKNSGAAMARNIGIEKSSGRFLAFLDSDDSWEPEKLRLQLKFMVENNHEFTCTNYKKIDVHGNNLGIEIKAQEKSDYMGLLKNCPGNSTVMLDLKRIKKIYGHDIKKRNDYVLWLSVIKKVQNLYGLNSVLSSHRIRENSISSNKFSLLKYHWHIYRNIEKLSLFKSIFLMFYWIMKSVKIMRVKKL